METLQCKKKKQPKIFMKLSIGGGIYTYPLGFQKNPKTYH